MKEFSYVSLMNGGPVAYRCSSLLPNRLHAWCLLSQGTKLLGKRPLKKLRPFFLSIQSSHHKRESAAGSLLNCCTATWFFHCEIPPGTMVPSSTPASVCKVSQRPVTFIFSSLNQIKLSSFWTTQSKTFCLGWHRRHTVLRKYSISDF